MLYKIESHPFLLYRLHTVTSREQETEQKIQVGLHYVRNVHKYFFFCMLTLLFKIILSVLRGGNKPCFASIQI